MFLISMKKIRLQENQFERTFKQAGDDNQFILTENKKGTPSDCSEGVPISSGEQTCSRT